MNSHASEGAVRRTAFYHTFAVVVGILGFLCTAEAQSKKNGPAPKAAGIKETRVAVELVTGSEGVGLRAQEWAKIFAELNVTCKVRPAAFNEELATKEQLIGSLREVLVQGRLEKNGTITFSDRKFQQSELPKLKEWLQELQTFGAQGAPEGQPLWGLTRQQFEPIFIALSEPLATDPQGEELLQALPLFKLPAAYPLRLTRSAEESLQQLPEPPVIRKSLQGMTQGTALAIVLGESGLGFRPRRTPESQFELIVLPLRESSEVWPIGWPLTKKGPAIAPQLYKVVKIDLSDEIFTDVLNAASDVLKIPILVDDYGLRLQKIDLAKAKVSHSPKQTTWSAALKSMAFQARVRREIWMDEGGKPFVWITSMLAKRKAQE